MAMGLDGQNNVTYTQTCVLDGTLQRHAKVKIALLTYKY